MLQGFFNYDNPIWRFIGRLGDMVVLNILWIICSIPIITIGASTTALYYCTLKIVRNEDYGDIKMFIFIINCIDLAYQYERNNVRGCRSFLTVEDSQRNPDGSYKFYGRLITKIGSSLNNVNLYMQGVLNIFKANGEA